MRHKPPSKPPKSKKAPASDHGAPGEPRPVEEVLKRHTETLKRSGELLAEALKRSGELLERSEAVINQLQDDLRDARDVADEAANLVDDLLAEIERVFEIRALPLGFRLLLEEAAIRSDRLPSW